MTIETLVTWLIVGAIAGFLASALVRGGNAGLIGNIVIGIIGAFVGGWLFRYFGVATGAGLLSAITGATIGAVLVLFLVRIARRVA